MAVSPISFKIADAFVDVEFRTQDASRTLDKNLSGRKVTVDAEADTTKASRDVDQFVRDANGRFHDAKGRYVAEADVARATSNLQIFDNELRKVDGKTARANVDLDIGAALMKAAGLTAVIGSIGSLGVAALGGLAGVGAVVGAGLGSVMVGMSGIGDAVKAMSAAETESGKTAAAASTQHRAMADAIRGVGDANEALSNAKANAASQIQRAEEAVEQSERRLSSAQEDEKQAQEDLTAARKTAAEQLADLQRRTEDMALSQESAAISVARAEESLNRVKKDAKATSLDRAEAELRVREALQRQKETAQDAKRLAQEKAAADKAGVEGSKVVVDATQKISDAHGRVVDAQRGVQTATRSLADTQRQTAYQVAQAQEAVVRAQERVRDVSQQAGTQGSAGVNKLAQAMAALTPAGREFATFMKGFIDGPLKKLKDAGQSNLLPGLQAGLKALVPLMGPVTTAFGGFSKSLGQALGGIIPIIGQLAAPFLNFASAALKGLQPLEGVLKTFATQLGSVFTQLTKSGAAQAAMNALVRVVGAILPAIPGLIQLGTQLFAVLGPPLAQALGAIVPVISTIAKAFAPVATVLLGSIAKMAPVINQIIAQVVAQLAPVLPQLVTAFVALVIAFLPLLPPLTSIVVLFAKMAPTLVTALIPAINLLVAGIQAASGWIQKHETLVKSLVVAVGAGVLVWKAWQLAIEAWGLVTKIAIGIQTAFNMVMNANPVMLVVTAIAALAAGLVYAYTHCETFRKIVDSAWAWIKTAISTVWDWLKPNVIDPFVSALKVLGGWCSDLYSKYVKPAWDSIKSAIDATWSWIKTNIIDKAVAALKVLGGWFTDLWNKYVSPAWTGIKSVIQIQWTIVQGLFDLAIAALKVLGGWFSDLYSKYVKPAFDSIKNTLSSVWAWIKTNVIDKEIESLQILGGWFSDLYAKYVKPAWDSIKSAISTVWTWLKDNVFTKFSDTISGLGGLFENATKAISKAWDKVKDAAKTPVQFVVNSVMIPLADAWNAIIGKVDSGLKWNVTRMASGGPISGPGNGTSDDVPIMASNGEWIIRAKAAQQIGPAGMAAINQADRHGLTVTGDIGTALIRRYADGGLVSATQGWLRTLTNTPYVWGGVGPGGYDCSALVGEVWARLTGHPSYRRYFTTTSFLGAPSSWGFQPGTGTFTVGVNSHHMVGNLGGLGFEAPHTGANIRIGSSAQTTGAVGAQYYLTDYGAGGGGGFSPLEFAKSAVKGIVDKLTAGWWSALSGMGFFGNAGVSIGKRLVSAIFDQGGMLPTGTSITTNLSGRPEPVFSPSQWETLRALVPTQGGAGAGVTYKFEPGAFSSGAFSLDLSQMRDVADVVRTVTTLAATARSLGGAARQA